MIVVKSCFRFSFLCFDSKENINRKRRPILFDRKSERGGGELFDGEIRMAQVGELT